MEESSELPSKLDSGRFEREKNYVALQARCQKVFKICDQQQQTFFRLLSALSQDGEKTFARYGQEYIRLFAQSMQAINKDSTITFSFETLPDLLEKTIACLETEYASSTDDPLSQEIRKYSLPVQKSSPTDTPVRERPKSAPLAHQHVYTPRSNSISLSKSPSPRSPERAPASTASPRSKESSPRKFFSGLFSPKRTNGTKTKESPRSDFTSAPN